MSLSPVRLLACFAATLVGCASVHAAPLIFFGENQEPSQAVTGDPLSARNSFVANLGGFGTETMESQTAFSTAPLALAFPGSLSTPVTATINGAGQVFPTPSSAGRFNTTNATAGPAAGQWWSAEAAFSITFDAAISGFGFYGTDIGDADGQLIVTLTDVTGADSVYTVPHAINGRDGALLFWGFVDADKSYTKISFGNTASGFDVFGIDDMIVGNAAVVPPPTAPEPSSIALLGACVLGAFAASRKRA